MHDHLYNVPHNPQRICFGYGFTGLDWQVSARLYELEVAAALWPWNRRPRVQDRRWYARPAAVLARVMGGIRAWHQRRQTYRSLMALDTLMLKDIGISRSMIPGITTR